LPPIEGPEKPNKNKNTMQWDIGFPVTLYKLKYLRCVVEATEKIYWFLSNVPDTIVFQFSLAISGTGLFAREHSKYEAIQESATERVANGNCYFDTCGC